MIRIFILVTIMISISGCRVILTQEQAAKEQKIKASEVIEIDAKLLVHGKRVHQGQVEFETGR
ncbi:hypothetical protein HF072_14445 [Bacillus sp. RO3]|nr:hypothetical protein [Bacillus sp. RO3]